MKARTSLAMILIVVREWEEFLDEVQRTAHRNSRKSLHSFTQRWS